MKTFNPSEAQTFVFEEFAFAFALAVHAGHLQIPVHPQHYKVDLEDEDGEVSTLRFTDTRMNRAAIALKEHFGQEYEKFESAMWRFMAFIDLVRNDALVKWIRDSATDPQAKEVHPAFIEVCGQMRLTRQGKFSKNRFLQALERIAKEKYPDS